MAGELSTSWWPQLTSAFNLAFHHQPHLHVPCVIPGALRTPWVMKSSGPSEQAAGTSSPSRSHLCTPGKGPAEAGRSQAEHGGWKEVRSEVHVCLWDPWELDLVGPGAQPHPWLQKKREMLGVGTSLPDRNASGETARPQMGSVIAPVVTLNMTYGTEHDIYP